MTTRSSRGKKSKEAVVGEFRKRTIQEAAMRVIAREGLAAASMQAIADEAEVAKGTIYLYFKDRRDLVWKTADVAFLGLLDEMKRALADPGTFASRLDVLVRKKLEFFDQQREFFRVYMALCHPEGETHPKTRRARMEHPLYQVYLDLIADFLAQASTGGEIRPVDSRRVALFLAEGVNAVVLRRLSETHPVAAEEDVKVITGLLLHGLLPTR